MQSDETVVTTATYRGCGIALTTYNRYIVTVYGLSYPAATLDAAKKMIDDLVNARRN